jgi:hypothetical protein
LSSSPSTAVSINLKKTSTAATPPADLSPAASWAHRRQPTASEEHWGLCAELWGDADTEKEVGPVEREKLREMDREKMRVSASAVRESTGANHKWHRSSKNLICLHPQEKYWEKYWGINRDEQHDLDSLARNIGENWTPSQFSSTCLNPRPEGSSVTTVDCCQLNRGEN